MGNGRRKAMKKNQVYKTKVSWDDMVNTWKVDIDRPHHVAYLEGDKLRFIGICAGITWKNIT